MSRHLVRVPSLALVLALTIGSTALADSPTSRSTESLARRALAANGNESAKAVAQLRSMGPEGLRVFLETNHKKIEAALKAIDSGAHLPTGRDQVLAALDSICQQKDCHASRLYWHTDLDQARSASRASGKPILSLRLLGRLDEDLSCANSRLFRITLYANEQVSRLLRERFVLHWQSVRPVPRLTIDFGDGRTMQRTLTGNSIHYVLDTEGNLLEAIPGLYGPAAFLRGLNAGEQVFRQVNSATQAQRFEVLYKYHRARANAIQVAWYHDTQKLGGTIPEGLKLKEGAEGEALAVMPIAITKAFSETNMLRAMIGGAEALGRVTDELAWQKIAAMHSADGELDAASIGLIKRQTQKLFVEGRTSAGSRATFHNLLQKLQASVALDTVRNEYLLRTKLHAWLVRGPRGQDVDAFNEKVYAELFLTPSSDPWLGLLSPEAYTALENGGVK